MGILISIFVIVFVAIVMVAAVIFLFMEASNKLDNLRQKAPWFVNLIERRESVNVLLAVCLFLLLGNGYELVVKEIPEVPAPPIVRITPPPPPQIVSPSEATAKPSDQSRPVAQPIPTIEHMTLVQEPTHSTHDAAPYAIKLTIQATIPVNPVMLNIWFESPLRIVEDLSRRDEGMIWTGDIGIAKDPRCVVVEFYATGLPVLRPDLPIIFRVESDQPIKFAGWYRKRN